MANRYWVGGTGNWSNTARWSETSGGAGGASVPTAADNVIFDTASASDNYTVTVDAAATCLDFTMGKPDGVGKKVTWAGTAALAISGSINLSGGTAGITRSYSGTLTMNGTGTKTITTVGVSLAKLTFNNSGGTYQLADPLASISSMTLTAGTFDPQTYEVKGNVGGFIITGNFTFYDLKMIGSTGKTYAFNLSGSPTVSHTLTLAGNSAINRLLVYSSVIGTQRTITLGTGATISASNVDFKDIKLYNTDTSGADLDLSAITGLSGDCGGNDGIIFTDSDTMTWKDGDGGNWSDVGNWTKTAAAADRVPLPQDDVNLGIAFNPSQTVTADMPRLGRSISWAGATGSPEWTTSLAASIFGSLDLTDLGTLTASTQTYTFEGRAANMPVGGWTLTSAGNSWAKEIDFKSYLGTYKLVDDFVTTGQIKPSDSSIIDANDQDITFGFLYPSTITSPFTLYMGSGTWTATSDSGSSLYIAWGVGANSTINCETSIIKIINSNNDNIQFIGGAKSYNNVWFSRGTSTGSNTITGSNTFNQLKDTGTEAHSLIFTAGTTQTFTGTTPFMVNGSAGKLITLASSTTTAFNLVSTSGYDISCDYLSISRSNASPVNTWYAGINSTNGGNNTGWNFTVPKHDDFLIMF